MAWTETMSLIGPVGADGVDGADGDNGADGRTVLNGTGTPDPGDGIDGDFYINTAAFTIYGPKTSGTWGSPASLKGNTGDTGATGPAGPSTGAAGGSLAGTYPNPTLAADSVGSSQIAADAVGSSEIATDAVTSAEIAAGAVGTAELATGAVTGNEIAAAVKDPAAATAGLRTLGTGSTQALPGNHSSTTDSRAPNGTAGGVLNGTYPNPSLDLVTSAPYTHATTTGTVTVDPTLGNNCYVGALTGNIVLTPSTTGALDGQMLMVQVRGHASSTFTITNTGPTLTTGLTSPFSLVGGKYAFLGYRYSATLSAWVLLAYTASL